METKNVRIMHMGREDRMVEVNVGRNVKEVLVEAGYTNPEIEAVKTAIRMNGVEVLLTEPITADCDLYIIPKVQGGK